MDHALQKFPYCFLFTPFFKSLTAFVRKYFRKLCKIESDKHLANWQVRVSRTFYMSWKGLSLSSNLSSRAFWKRIIHSFQNYFQNYFQNSILKACTSVILMTTPFVFLLSMLAHSLANLAICWLFCWLPSVLTKKSLAFALFLD